MINPKQSLFDTELFAQLLSNKYSSKVDAAMVATLVAGALNARAECDKARFLDSCAAAFDMYKNERMRAI